MRCDRLHHQADLRRKRRLRTPSRVRVAPGSPVVVPTFKTLRAAIAQLPPDLAWDDVADLIMPIFERLRPFPPGFPQPIAVAVPPGVSIGFAIDVGPGFVRVHSGLLERWPVDARGLTERALANLRRRIAGPAPRAKVVHDRIDGVRTVAFQSGEGWASTLLLVPDEIARLVGPEPRLFVAPMRDVLIGLPPDVDLAFGTRLTEELEALDPNALCLEGFFYRDGTLACRPLLRDAVPA